MLRAQRLPCLERKVNGMRGTDHDQRTMHCIQNVCPLSRPSDARSSIIYSNVRYDVSSLTNEVPTDLSSASLVGTGHVPGSRVIARKKLYAHRPNDKAKMRWENACDSVSIYRVLVLRGRWIEENSRCRGRVAQANATQTMEPNMMPEK